MLLFVLADNMDEHRKAVVIAAITLSNEFLRRHVFFDTDSETR